MSLHLQTATKLHEAFASGKLTALEITTHFLNRIESYNDELGAFLTVYKERALEQAQALDEKKANGQPFGRLAGVPIAVKDNIHVDGQLTTCASKFLENYTAIFDSTVVRLMEAEDAIILGKTNLDEFAMGSSTEHSALKDTCNPWNTDKSPGGSSGGSAVAVAARLCPISLGSDTGGSVRQPASFCGTLGFKPTYGRVSRYGLVAFGSSLDQISPFANSAEDIALIMSVIGQRCEKDSTSLDKDPDNYTEQLQAASLAGKKIGVPRGLLKDLDAEIVELYEARLRMMEKAGAEIVDITLDTSKYSLSVYYILATAEASTNLARFDGVRYGKRSEDAKSLDDVYDLSKEEGFGIEVKRRILLGTYVLSGGYQDAYYKKAQKVRTLIIRDYAQAFEKCDFVCVPTAPTTAFDRNSMLSPMQEYLADIFTISVNLAGLPSMSVPAGFDSQGMPFGIQLTGPQRADVEVCAVAKAFEEMSEELSSAPKRFTEDCISS